MLNTDMLLDAMTGIRDEYVIDAHLFIGEEETKMTYKKIWRTALIAAVISSLFIAAAYAVFGFAINSRKAGADEVFATSFARWEDAKLVYEFTGPTQCSMIEFKPNYLPIEPTDGCKESYCKDGWYTILYVFDTDPDTWPYFMPEYDPLTFNNPYRIDVYYASQFTSGGNAILLDHTPDEIIETEINGCKVQKFHATMDQGLFVAEYNYLIMFNGELGYMIVISGKADLDIMERIAENMEIRTTDQIISYEDFDEHNEYIDTGIG